jgi:lipopolysaccharide/colanic/teichoic acid biosynthesis glycosyltransferase
MNASVRIAKRTIDLIASVIGLAITVPFYPIIAAAIYLESPGQIFFRQRRAGQLIENEDSATRGLGFSEFDMFKFRTMRPNAEAHTGVVVAAEGDARVTRVGRFLRRTRLDEVPQLWNVLRGDMSLVGPRPERPELLHDLALAIPFFEERMRGVKPGITGMAQVSLGYTGRPRPGSDIEKYTRGLTNPFKIEGAEGALADDMRIKLLYDCAYSAAIETLPSFLRTEFAIILKTPIVMLRGLGR